MKTSFLKTTVGRMLFGIFGAGMLVWGLLTLFGRDNAGLPSSQDIDLAAAHAAASLKDYQSPDGSFKVRYPADWKLEQSSPPLLFHAATYEGMVNVRLTVEDLSPNATIETYVRANVEGMTKSLGAMNPIKRSEDMVTIHGTPAAKLVFSLDLDKGLKAQDLMTVYVRNGKGYVMVCSSTKDMFAPFQPVFDMIAESLEFL